MSRDHVSPKPPLTILQLFDMDGTIIDSTDAIVKHWQQLGQEIGVNGDEILKTSHGRRSIDVLKLLAPEKATWECKSAGVNLPHTWLAC
jgi:glycerol 3-phosphatase-1